MAEDLTEVLEVATIRIEKDKKARLPNRQERKELNSRPMLKVERSTVEDIEAAVAEEDIEATMIAIRMLVQQTQRAVLTPSTETTMLRLKEESLQRVVNVS